MLDDDDINFAVLLNMGAAGWGALIGIIIVVVMLFIVASNKEECARKHCERGSPILMHHECLCVERPEAP